MFIEERIKLFVALGQRLETLSAEELEEVAVSAHNHNSWFTQQSVEFALGGIRSFLDQAVLEDWVNGYDLRAVAPQKIGVIAAGNIPLVGFHDILSVLISGHKLLIKPSSDDSYLTRWILNELVQIDDRIASSFMLVDRLNDADAFIATGSDNTARYFKYYFKDKPSIIRANRSSVSVLTGEESKEELAALGQDIFQYYGLGCRNVSKILVPEGFDLTTLLDALQPYEWVIDHHKYRNNYDYNKSIYLVNREPHLDNEFLLVRESEDLVSPISVLYYQTYESEAVLKHYLTRYETKIQCIVGRDYIPFGQAQTPTIDDYADGIDTLGFLSSL
ncbi:acyl-CoA reductase [Reichenbachiella sp. 5M10]|uniref:acyl-CoA reductase n=1 Tax=Reichenbachiella sp. 5M10 TaxID=1889772 RepID=UPI000C146469|nr:acyl-CoA reductase [Reichenbachiella sp. 5M10]PIB34542.1 acyl-CoA reductase [Reichenbachiella sp. 5M10]